MLVMPHKPPAPAGGVSLAGETLKVYGIIDYFLYLG